MKGKGLTSGHGSRTNFSSLITIIILVITVLLAIKFVYAFFYGGDTAEERFPNLMQEYDFRHKLASDTTLMKNISSFLIQVEEFQPNSIKTSGPVPSDALLKELQEAIPTLVAIEGWQLNSTKESWKRLFHRYLPDGGKVIEIDHPSTDSAIFDSTPSYYSDIQWHEDSAILISKVQSHSSGFQNVHFRQVCLSDSLRCPIRPVRGTFYFFSPYKGAFWLLANLIILSISLAFLMGIYQSREIPLPKYVKMFCWGLGIMSFTYTLRLAPAVLAFLGMESFSFWIAQLPEMIGYILPDDAFFVLCAWYILKGENRKMPGRLLVTTLILYFIANSFDFWNLMQLFLKIKTPFESLPGFWYELPSVFYSSLALTFIGYSIFRSWDQVDSDNKSDSKILSKLSFYNIKWVILILFCTWAISQYMYLLRVEIDFYAIVFAAKCLALIGFVVHSYMERVLKTYGDNLSEYEKQRQEILQGIGKRSLDIILALQKTLRIVWVSTRARSMLGIDDNKGRLKDFISDPNDYQWLIQLIRSRKLCEDFEMSFKTKAKGVIQCSTTFIPVETGQVFDLIIARPFESVLMANLEQRFHIHGLQGTINSCKSWLQQFTDFGKDNYWPGAKSHIGIKKLDEGLDNLLSEIKPVSDVKLDLSESNLCSLDEVMSEIRYYADQKQSWHHLKIDIVNNLGSPAFVRAKKKVLAVILCELLNNANKKAHDDVGNSELNVKIEIKQGNSNGADWPTFKQRMISIVVCDDGQLIPTEVVRALEDTHNHSIIDERSSGLRRIKFYMRLFGGEFKIHNKVIITNGGIINRPTFELLFWQIEKEDNNE
jgi:hypothetical protein